MAGFRGAEPMNQLTKIISPLTLTPHQERDFALKPIPGTNFGLLFPVEGPMAPTGPLQV